MTQHFVTLFAVQSALTHHATSHLHHLNSQTMGSVPTTSAYFFLQQCVNTLLTRPVSAALHIPGGCCISARHYDMTSVLSRREADADVQLVNMNNRKFDWTLTAFFFCFAFLNLTLCIF